MSFEVTNAQSCDAIFTRPIAAPEGAVQKPVRKLPLLILALISIFAPAWGAKRSLHIGLLKCWFLHAAIALLGTLGLVASVLAYEQSLAAVFRELDSILADWARQPVTVTASMLGVALLIEACHFGVAAALMPWGAAGAERLRDSFRHALRQIWLRTPHAILVATTCVTFALFIDAVTDRWYVQNPQPPPLSAVGVTSLPTVSPMDPGYAQALYKVQEARRRELAAPQASWETWRNSRPWYVRSEEEFCVLLGFALTVWWIVALLRALGIERILPAARRQPLCLWCGYDLSTIPAEGRCPECGEFVESSLGPDAQPGAPWENRDYLGAAAAWWRTLTGWLLRTDDFGRGLQVDAQRTDHRTFLLLHLPVIFLVAVAGVFAAFLQNDGSLWDVPVASTLFGTLCMAGTLGVACGVAAKAGFLRSLQARRNLLPAAMQVSAYGATYLVLWAAFGAALINSMIALYNAGWFDVVEKFTGWHEDFLIFIGGFVPNFLCAIFYLWNVARGTHAARHANC